MYTSFFFFLHNQWHSAITPGSELRTYKMPEIEPWSATWMPNVLCIANYPSYCSGLVYISFLPIRMGIMRGIVLYCYIKLYY